MRQAILNAATSLFAAHGYNYVRIADIAKQVGISDAGVLHQSGPVPRRRAIARSRLPHRHLRGGYRAGND